MVGLLFFLNAIPSGRAFNCRLYAAMSQVKKPYHLVRLSLGMKEDIRIWLLFYIILMVKPFLVTFSGHLTISLNYLLMLQVQKN